MKRFAALAACVLLLAGCDQGPESARTDMHVSTQLSGDGNRVSVTRLSKFRDDIAYGNERGVYLIHDNQTGKEFIGISGIGITEMSSHTYQCGKSRCTTGDER